MTKRVLDVVLAAAGLVIGAPFMLGVAAAIKLDSPGPAMFRQQRLGLGARPFTLLKFRTMKIEANEDAHREHISRLIRGRGPRADAEDEPAVTPRDATWTPIPADSRVTRLGGVLRRTHVDELPQLLNVLKGDMSLVGPRPPIPYEFDLYEDWQRRRLAVRPGLTGLWQVAGWGRLTFDEGVVLDLEYIERRSIGLDLWILLRTLVQIVRGRQF